MFCRAAKTSPPAPLQTEATEKALGVERTTSGETNGRVQWVGVCVYSRANHALRKHTCSPARICINKSVDLPSRKCTNTTHDTVTTVTYCP